MSFLLRNILTKFEGCSNRLARYSSSITAENENPEIKPIISISEAIAEGKFYEKPKQVWLENLDTIQERQLGLMLLHPDVFGAQPRIDILHQNVRWQKLYKYVVSLLFIIYLTQSFQTFLSQYLIISIIPELRALENTCRSQRRRTETEATKRHRTIPSRQYKISSLAWRRASARSTFSDNLFLHASVLHESFRPNFCSYR